MTGTVHARIDGVVGTLVLDHPERRNATSLAMYEAIPAAVRTLRDALREAFPGVPQVEGDLFGGVATGLAYA